MKVIARQDIPHPPPDPQSTNVNYKVSLGQVARTINYEDKVGAVCLAFDVETTGDGRKKVYLERGKPPLEDAERARRDLVSARMREYLVSRGYEVEYFDEWLKTDEGQDWKKQTGYKS